MPAPTTTTTTTTMPPGPWQCTPLVAGPLVSNSYCMTISGLLPSTCYEYRAKFVVSGCTYYGNILGGTTQAIAMTAPIVTTGIAPHPALTDGYITCNHTVDDNGNSIIEEYGILYTANPSYNGDTTLVCGNLPTNVLKTSVCGSISEATPYSALATGLPSNTVTYYRAFAVNGVGVGYGCIYSKITAALPVDVCLFRVYTAGQNSANGCICTDPLLTTGQYLTLQVGMEQNVTPAYGIGCSILEIFCKPSASPYYTLIDGLYTNETELHKMQYASIPMSEGDMICWQQSTTGGYGSCSEIFLANIPYYSPDINPMNDLVYYCDCVYT